MKKASISVVLLAMSMSLSSPYAAASMIDWLFVKPVEKAIDEEVVARAIVRAVMNPGTAKNGGKAKTRQAVPVAGRVEEGDYRRLPLTGRLRFPVPKDTDLAALEVGPAGGYLDRFGSEWIPYRTSGRLVAWRMNLSDRGRLRLSGIADGTGFILVDREGKKITVSDS
ncbi:MAG: hypothetical protein LDL19_00570 [Thiobacillus sp.]|nr:hypothetical protein [Thiobacillus sp.]